MTMRNVLCTRVRPGSMQGGGSLGCLWMMAGVLMVAPMTAEACKFAWAPGPLRSP